MAKKRRFLQAVKRTESSNMEGTTEGANIDAEFLRLVAKADLRAAEKLLPQVKNINLQDETHGSAAIHYLAARSAEQFIELVEAEHPDLDYLLKDSRGRYPSEAAWDYGKNNELGHKLMLKEKAQAEARGIQLFPAPDLG